MLTMTLEQLRVVHRTQIDNLIDEAGSISHLATMLGISADTVQSWSHRGRISKSGALMVENHALLGTYFMATDLRPELEQQKR